MQEYYEELWERLPDGLEPPDFARRLAFLRGERQSSDRVLDLGCGGGEFTAVLSQVGGARDRRGGRHGGRAAGPGAAS